MARRNYYYEMQHILAWAVVVGMIEGNVAAVVVAKTFNASEHLINIAATTPVAAHLFSLLWGQLCIGRRKVHLFALCCSGSVLFAGSVAFNPPTDTGAIVFVIQMAVAQFFFTGAVTSRSALWKSNYPKRIRGAIVARLQIVRSVIYLLTISLVARLFDTDPHAYRWVYPIIAMFGGLSIWFIWRTRLRNEVRDLRRMRDVGNRAPENLTEPIRLRSILALKRPLAAAIRVLHVDVRFRHYCIAQMCVGCANLMLRTVVIIILTRDLLVDMGREYWTSLVLLEALPAVARLFTMRRFAAYFDSVGVLRFRVLNAVIWVITIVLGALGTVVVVGSETFGPTYLPIAVLIFALFACGRGVCAGAGVIAWNLGHLHFARHDDAEVYMGIHMSLTGLRGLIMPTVGVLIWGSVGWTVWCISIVLALVALYGFYKLARQESLTDGSK